MSENPQPPQEQAMQPTPMPQTPEEVVSAAIRIELSKPLYCSKQTDHIARDVAVQFAAKLAAANVALAEMTAAHGQTAYIASKWLDRADKAESALATATAQLEAAEKENTKLRELFSKEQMAEFDAYKKEVIRDHEAQRMSDVLHHRDFPAELEPRIP